MFSTYFSSQLLPLSMKEKPSIISCHFRGIKGLLMISIFLFDKFRKTHSHQHAISRVIWFFKFWIWICQIHKDSLTPTCDFPGSKDFQVLNLNLSPVWKCNKNSILTLTLFLFLIWKKVFRLIGRSMKKKYKLKYSHYLWIWKNTKMSMNFSNWDSIIKIESESNRTSENLTGLSLFLKKN